jgi:hypothetical protein
MSRAHEESLTKSKRLKASWESKHKKARDHSTPITKRIPAWLRYEKGEFIVLEDRAQIIKRIFCLTINGYG